MPRNDSQRAAHNKYEAKTYTVVGAKLHKADAAKLKALLAVEGLTTNAFLTKCCLDYIHEHEPEE